MLAQAERQRDVAEPGRAEALDVERIRGDFPVLHQSVHGRPLVYLDNAATTQKPQAVIDAIAGFYARDYANVHRGVHALSARADAAYEGARERVRRFVNAEDRAEIVFVRGTTEALNLVAQSYGRTFLEAGDEILITEMEHHANIVPWRMLCDQIGAVLRVAPIDDRGELILAEFDRLLGPRTRIVAVTHVSNALGTINLVKALCAKAHAVGAIAVVDGAQAVPHLPVDVREIGCDFYAFSAHKMYGPSGIGALYGRRELLERMPPYQGGGDMILRVSFEHVDYNRVPFKFEAGTPHIAGVVGWAAAIDYLESLGLERIGRHEHDLLVYAQERLGELGGVRLVGQAREQAAVVSMTVEGIHPHDIGTVLDREGIAIRAGHHCAMPVMTRFCVPATVRASFGLYNTRAEVDALIGGLRKTQEIFIR